jgi:PadR family transcriptional regulator, regulatory protein AphA
MSIENAILGLLSTKPLSGYDIKKMFEGSTALYWSGNNNQIYTSLVKLHKEGLVSSEVQYQESRPSRKLYTLTEKGLAKLRQWVVSDPELPQLRHNFLIQLAWADRLSFDELDDLLKKYEDETQAQVLMLRAEARQNNITPSGQLRDAYVNVALARTPREAYLWEMIQKNWIAFYENEIDWVCELREGLRKQETQR